MLKSISIVGFLLCIWSTTNGQFTKDDFKRLQTLECNEPSVTLHIFSGTENPVWKIKMQHLSELKKFTYEYLFRNNSASLFSRPTNRVMGYHGFSIRCTNENYVFIHGLSPLEHLLLHSGHRYLSPRIMSHVKEHIGEIMSDLVNRNFENTNCNNVPIVGPDTVPAYDPKTDDQGCFVTKQSENNCYAYGTDIVTNTFPQPGRGSGKKWSFNTCTDMGNASVRDGLVYNGTKLPVHPPEKGHFVALLIWPETNFHWIRMDNGGYWSHKPGGTAVRNRDNRGLPITDPSKSDFSPWTQFCAYFIAQPSILRIN